MPSIIVEQLVGILNEMLEFLKRPGIGVAWTDYDSIQDAIDDLASYIGRVKKNDLSRIFDLRVLFAPTGSLQDISISNGWGNQFLELAARFDRAIGESD